MKYFNKGHNVGAKESIWVEQTPPQLHHVFPQLTKNSGRIGDTLYKS